MTSSPPLLEAVDLDAGYGPRPVLHRARLTCQVGTVTALIGPNGSGKSTLLKSLAGLLHPLHGDVRLLGQPLNQWPAAARARAIGYLPQQPRSHWPLAVERLAALGRLPHLSPWSAPTGPDHHAVERALQETDLTPLRLRPVDQLSGGEALRAHLARVLAGQPQVILADEPLAALDLRHQVETAALFRRLAHRQGCAVLIVLHDLSMAARIADHLLLLDQGQTIAQGPPASVLTVENLRRAYGVDVRIQWEPHPPVISPLDQPETSPT